jgi:Na+-transporting methylmalonyl-CoA/oxaloacetate decarboxylase gamma subunit
MIDTLQIADSIKTAIDTAVTVINSPDNFDELTFSLDNIIKGDGLLITVVGYVVVFTALLVLYLAIAQVSKILISQTRKKLEASGLAGQLQKENLDISGEVNAAISMALHLYFEETHDFENTILTIKKVHRPYSPWSSKIYGIRQLQRK